MHQAWEGLEVQNSVALVLEHYEIEDSVATQNLEVEQQLAQVVPVEILPLHVLVVSPGTRLPSIVPYGTVDVLE